MSSFKDHFTRESANEGTKIPLSLPDGTDSSDWIHIRSIDSDHYRRAEIEFQRECFNAIPKDKEGRGELSDEEIDKKIESYRHKLFASLIKDWSFEEDCNQENKESLVFEAPHIADKIEEIAKRREFFVKKKGLDSLRSQLQTSD